MKSIVLTISFVSLMGFSGCDLVKNTAKKILFDEEQSVIADVSRPQKSSISLDDQEGSEARKESGTIITDLDGTDTKKDPIDLNSLAAPDSRRGIKGAKGVSTETEQAQKSQKGVSGSFKGMKIE